MQLRLGCRGVRIWRCLVGRDGFVRVARSFGFLGFLENLHRAEALCEARAKGRVGDSSNSRPFPCSNSPTAVSRVPFRAKPLYDHQPACHLQRENTAIAGEFKVLFQRFEEVLRQGFSEPSENPSFVRLSRRCGLSGKSHFILRSTIHQLIGGYHRSGMILRSTIHQLIGGYHRSGMILRSTIHRLLLIGGAERQVH